MHTFASTRARACAIAGLLAGSLTLLAALTYEPSASAGVGERVRSANAAESASAARAAGAPGLLPPDRAGDLTEVALAAIPGVLPQHGNLEPGATGRTPTDADLAARRQQVRSTASRGAVRHVAGPLSAWPAGGAMTGWYGEPRARHRHAGIDLDAGYGAPVVAAGPGTVVAAGRAPSSYAGYGIVVIIDHGGGVQTLSAHLSSTSVVAGQRLAAGERVGAVGTTGSVTGPHLHFEVRVNGAPVDPLVWLPAR